MLREKNHVTNEWVFPEATCIGCAKVRVKPYFLTLQYYAAVRKSGRRYVG